MTHETSPELPPQQAVSTRLESQMSAFFDVCSTLSAKANNLIQEKLADKKVNTKEMHILNQNGEYTDAVLMKAVELGRFFTNDERIGNEATVVLGRRISVLNNPEDSVDPQLLVVTRDGIALNVASFAMREGSACSYVQLGDEMYDKNIVVAPRDERKDIVGSMVNFFEKSEYTDPFLSFIRRQIFDKKKEQIYQQLNPAICRKIHADFNDSKTKGKNLHILQSDSIFYQELTGVYTGAESTVLEDGRQVEFWMGRVKGEEPVTVYALARRDVAVPLAKVHEGKVLDATTGEELTDEQMGLLSKAVFEQRITRTGDDRRYKPEKLVKSIKKEFRRGNMSRVAYAKAHMDYLDPDNSIDFDIGESEDIHLKTLRELRTRYECEKNLEALIRTNDVGDNLVGFEDKSKTKHLDDRVPSYLIKKRRFPWGEKYDDNPGFLYLYRLFYLTRQTAKKVYARNNSQSLRAFMDSMDASQKIDAQLGEFLPVEEETARRIGRLARIGSSFEGEIKDVEIDGQPSEVSFALKVEEDKKGVQKAVVRARPTHFPQQNMAKTHEVTIDKTKPIDYGSGTEKDCEFDQADKDELLRILKAAMPKK